MDTIQARVLGGPQHGRVYTLPRDYFLFSIPLPDERFDPCDPEYSVFKQIAHCPVVPRYKDLHPPFLADLIRAGEVVAYIDFDNAIIVDLGVGL